MKTADISVEYIQHTGSDLMVANAARVSFDKESTWLYDSGFPEMYIESLHNGAGYTIDDPGVTKTLSEKDAKLIRYLANHKHFSPFNHSFITVKVRAPIFVSRQLVKHEYMPINEISRRYVDDEPTFYFPSEWRKRAENKKQGSSDEVFVGDIAEALSLKSEECARVCLDTYNFFLEKGVCPEQARMHLPLNMNTEWYWSGTLKAFAKMLSLRLDPHTQKESTDVAKEIRQIIEPLFPVSVPALLAIN